MLFNSLSYPGPDIFLSAAHEHGFRYPRNYLEVYVQSMYLRAELCRTNADATRQVTKQRKEILNLARLHFE